ncbi:catalase, partial [Mycolicibacterium sphagni]
MPAKQNSASDPDAVEPGIDAQGAVGSGHSRVLTTAQGVRIPDTDHSLKAGERGPTLLEDFHMREKITHFDHECIPERVVHARGAAAHGVFESYGTAAPYTRAAFLATKAPRTACFTRFSTVVGSRGSADTVRDTRGFAVKFYTDEGNFPAGRPTPCGTPGDSPSSSTPTRAI